MDVILDFQTLTDKQPTQYLPRFLRIPKSECPYIWISLPRHKLPTSWAYIEDPVVLLERNLSGHPLAGLLRERQCEEVLLELGWEKVPNWECLLVHCKTMIILIGFRG